MAPTAQGTRWVDVPPERIVTWVANFAERHGPVVAEPSPEIVVLRATDGAVAECHPPFPPLRQPTGTADTPAAQAALMSAHAARDRTVGVLLVRLGGYAAGVFTGSPARLVASKTGSRLVHGRSAAGGWSQQRFARRRDNQAASALEAATDTAVAVFGSYQGQLDAVVLGGDRRAVAQIRTDHRLRPFLAGAVDRFLTVPEPRLAVLRDTPRLFQAVRIRLTG
ncbi:MAG TPA: acVLRF1 family peptidyl-tRNA hydrolase [Streptosporangiaceae bacterium]|nr:acVLRF1 family peptidyl-tRNA hydrolase [Streptosporangiaceae bacterium]